MYSYFTGKCFLFVMGNVSPSHWEKSPPFTLKHFPFLSLNVSFSIWEMFSLPTGKGFLFPYCRKMLHLFKGEPLIFPVGNVCPSIFLIGNVLSSLPTALVMFLLSREKLFENSLKFQFKTRFLPKM